MSEIQANFFVDIINIKRHVKGKFGHVVQIKVDYVNVILNLSISNISPIKRITYLKSIHPHSGVTPQNSASKPFPGLLPFLLSQ